MSSPLAAPAAESVDGFADFCERAIRVEDGSALVLEPFQRRMLEDVFAGTRETLILIPKKNGKTSLLGALALYHLITTPDAECVIAAASREQAGIMLRQAQGFITRSAALRERLTVKQREIVYRRNGSRARVLAADADTSDGVIPTLALVDEMHRQRSAELYGVFRDGLGPRDGQIITISTAGDDEMSPLGQLRSAAYRLPTLQRDGAYCYAASPGRQFVMHEWALKPDQDRDDLALVKSANPASWQTTEALRERHDSPSTTPWQWARFACGVWVRGESSAIDPADWDALEKPSSHVPPGSPVYLGWDVAWRGHRGDTMAIVPLWWQSEARRVVGEPIVLSPPEGGMLDDREVFSAFEALQSRFRILAVAYDPNAGAQAFAQQLERELGLVMAEHSQKDGPMALADGRLSEAIRRKELEHNGNRVLRQHVLNAAEKPVSGEQFRFWRPRNGPRRPIDCLTALSMAHSVALAERGHSRAEPSEWWMF